ncbi:MAG: hypothetical protein PQJ60_09475 [Spirochaetales bacterium]|nr:hypothetical protein [Spirochaetales bacterium]
MKILLLFTAYRQFREYEYQAFFINRLSRLKENMDLMILCNNREMPRDRLEEQIASIPLESKNITICDTNEYGYMRGQFEVLAKNEDKFRRYDYVIQLHPDVFITDEKVIFPLLEESRESEEAFFVSRCFGTDSKKYSTDFFIFKPALIPENFFRMCLENPLPVDQGAEPVLFDVIQSEGISHRIIDRFNNFISHKDIDNLHVWHEHNLKRVELYRKCEWFRHVYSFFLGIAYDKRLLLRAFKSRLVGIVRRRKGNSFFQQISVAGMRKIDQKEIIL